MSIFVMCECGQSLMTPEENAGRLAECPTCGRVLTVPSGSPSPDVVFISDNLDQSTLSVRAFASFGLGACFFFACLSGVPAILLGRQALRDIDRSGGRLRGKWMAVTGIVLGVFGCLVTLALLMPATRSAREAARRAQCVNNLKQIALAMHNYHSSNDCLPPAAITDKNGKPLLSWRVAILPFIESSPLYSQFHLDEPWDSPHNLTLLNPMPSIYACPSDKNPKPGMTGYLAVIGAKTAFTPDFKPLPFESFIDGMSSTILVGESPHSVPWTKPEDIPFDTPLPLHGLGSHHGYHNNGFNAAFVDGSVKFLKSSIGAQILRALLTRNGNETLSPDSY